MKKIVTLMLLLIFFSTFCFAEAKKIEYYPLNIKVKELLKSPHPGSEAEFVFPIDITLTGISKDKQWYRFKVSYDLVFFGKYAFEGWANVDPWQSFLTNATPEVLEVP